MIGRHCRTRQDLRCHLSIPGVKRRGGDQTVPGTLDFVGLDVVLMKRRRTFRTGSRGFEIARALATDPELLLLDEPAAGMNLQETKEITSLIKRIRDAGKTILLIEHDMRMVMGTADRVAVLDHGTKIAEGSPKEVQRDPAVIKAYLGDEANVVA